MASIPEVKSIDRAELIAAAKQFINEDYRRLKELGFVNRTGEFFPSGVHYPPITMYPPITQEEMFKGYRLPDDGLLDIYIHIPFCHQRCLFCHYPVKLGEQPLEKDLYLAALEKEMDIYMAQLGLDRIKARSILAGGGTPTYLTIPQLKRYFEFFTKRVDLSRITQYNYDVDPNTLIGPEGEERLRIMRDYGVDRLTIGVQALNDRTLANMNRHHSVKEALDSIDASRKYGYQLNIEFIFGYPGQTIDSWIDDIQMAMALDVDEIQMYRLKVDAYGDYQGPVKNIVEKQTLRVPDDEETLIMKKVAIDMLTANNFTENIRRVWSRTRKQFSHYAWNQCCMLYDEIGLGLTAFSSLRDRYVLNTQYFNEYYAMIETGKLPINRGLVRSPEEQKRWSLILPLKNSYVQKKIYRERTGGSVGNDFGAKLERLKEYGFIVEDEHRISSTRLGTFFADEMVQQFYSHDYIPVPRGEFAEGPLNPYNGPDTL
ncbi:MAG: radical SAM protein [Geobacteraceae bacterium]|nr:radical SAM protein [Geobacteraceae bacterium]